MTSFKYTWSSRAVIKEGRASRRGEDRKVGRESKRREICERRLNTKC